MGKLCRPENKGQLSIGYVHLSLRDVFYELFAEKVEIHSIHEKRINMCSSPNASIFYCFIVFFSTIGITFLHFRSFI